MDLLDFEAQGLYFEEPDVAGVKEMIATAAENYETGEAELPLLKAYFLAPQSLNVLVALNRYYYYQHRLEDALQATVKALAVIRPSIGFPEDWRDLQQNHISDTPPASLTQVRLYLFTLKAVGFLNMRLHNLDVSQGIFEKLVELDSKDRIGAKGLLELVVKRKTDVAVKDPLCVPLNVERYERRTTDNRLNKSCTKELEHTTPSPQTSLGGRGSKMQNLFHACSKANFLFRSKTMFKQVSESLMTIIALVAFIILAIYLLNQDPTLVGPI